VKSPPGAAVVLALALLAGSGVALSTPASAATAVPAAVAGGPGPLPPGTRAIGALPAASPLSVDVALRVPDPAALQAFDTAVTTPSSPQFRHFITPDQFAADFGPDPAAISATRAWLGAQGLTLGATDRDGLLIPVSGSAAALGAAFGVGFQRDLLPSGRVVHEPTQRPDVPSTLASVVQGVVGLDNVALATSQIKHPPPGPPGESPMAGPIAHTGPTACTSALNSRGITAPQLAQAYSFDSLEPTNEGQGVTIGVYELEPFANSDVTAFKTCYGITPTVTPVSVDGALTNFGPGSGESALDIEVVMGLAPRANVRVYVGQNGGVGPLDVYAAMVNQNVAQVLTTSWGECEPEAGTAASAVEFNILAEAAAQGQSFLAAAGDEGSEDCHVPGISNDSSLEVDDPASQPWVTSAGGTDLLSTSPDSESVWNTGLFEGTTGGGNSTLWTMPAWQLGPGVDSGYTKADDSYTGASPCPFGSAPGTVSCREVPDVSADGDPSTGYATLYDGVWEPIGGTSMDAPLWAAITALADESVASPPGRLGLLDPALYQAGCLNPRPFNDIVTGENEPLGSPPTNPPAAPPRPDYPATAGYDLASGLGSPIASALIPDLVTPVNACPAVTAMNTASGPAGGGTVVTLGGANLASAFEVDFGPGNPGTIVAKTATSITVSTPVSPTGGWAVAPVTVKTPGDVIGSDGRNYFTFTGLRGYWTTASDGGIFTFGQVGYHGSTGGIRLQKPVVGIAPTPSQRGYWLVASDGGVFAFGDAAFHGSTGGIRLDKPIVGMTSTPDGKGYWLVASDGGIFAFGDAGFFGSTGGIALNAPIVGMAATPDGLGYWLVASDGGIFAFGDASFFGSTGAVHLTKPIVGMATTPDGRGYWLAASDGGIFAFGNAVFAGSLGSVHLTRPIVGMATPFGGGGYWLVASDGGIFAFGSAPFAGSMGGHPLNAPMVGVGGS
jgi:hypothetical protein